MKRCVLAITFAVLCVWTAMITVVTGMTTITAVAEARVIRVALLFLLITAFSWYVLTLVRRELQRIDRQKEIGPRGFAVRLKERP